MKWFGAAAVFVAFQLCVAAAMAVALGFWNAPPLGKYGFAAALPAVLYAAGLMLWRLRSLPDYPVRHLAKYDWSDCWKFALAMGLVWFQFLSLTWMKAMIPLVTPMWADVPLANLEAAILGTDAWRILPRAGGAIGLLYTFWFPITCGCFAGAYFRQRPNRDALLLSFFLTVGLLGTFGQYLLPSGGPIFFERLGYGDRFAGLEVPDLANRTADYLWAAYSRNSLSFATGISAFPSIHVATTAWVAIAFRHPLAYAWLAVVFFGSIMLGWHYAIDGIAGIIGAVACYALARFIMGQTWFGALRLRFVSDIRTE